MTLFRLAMAYARRRPLSTLLVVVLLAIGVATVTLTLLLTHELEDRLTRDAAGIDLVVGAKGSPLQLVLAGVYHVDVPPGNIPLAAIAALRANPLIAQAIPLALGDSFRGFRIVGTEPALIEHYGGVLRAGELWRKPLEAVLGSTVAAASGLSVGATFTGSHGLAEGGGEHANAPYRVTGILATTGTVLDRLVLTSIASVWAVHEAHHADADHDHDAHGNEAKGDAHADEHAELDPGREVTLALVRYRSPLAAASLPRAINKETDLVAASPAYETARLLTVFGAGIDLIRAFALVLMAASGFMLFVALAQALEDRRYDLAILRTLGASRRQVASVLLAESLMLAAAGALLGLALAHLAALFVGRLLPEAAPLSAAASHWLPEEWGIVALAMGAGILAALWPAWRAWRLDVAATLADG
jgi:putative ABC transport system permease protein